MEQKCRDLINLLDQAHPHSLKCHVIFAIYLYDLNEDHMHAYQEFDKIKSTMEVMKISKAFWSEVE